ncbi:hypothetical protein T12_9011 [Trichinella patagoniensis]|uniref:CCHC-type domain-containing protein n=1 Tax=Trichinella patagoniensis TaxID=990121 RepID=A0A0V0ZRD8_9BILA|nr:hypothetical protein T12_9011 [Trichinella patagoniensis]
MSRSQKGLLLRPDLSAFARQWRARHKGGSGQTKGHGSVLPVFQRDKLGNVDEPSRSVTEGRSSEKLVRTLVKGIRIAVRDNGNSSSIRTLRACSLNVPCKRSQGTGRRPRRRSTSARVLETPTAAHAVEETPDPLELYSPLIFGWTNERLVNLYLKQSNSSDLSIVDTMASAAKSRSKKLVALKDRLNRLLAELDVLCTSCADVFEVEEQFSLMEESFRAADALQTEVELDLDGEERQAAIDDWALCRQNYRVGKARARARMVEARGEGPIGSCSVSPGMPAVRYSNGRLPEITLPKFTGKVLEFPSFWAQFEANVHKRRDLDNATEFTYLLSNTEGTARNAIEQVIREHLAALWREPACREMTAQGIQSLVDEVTKHLRCLTALDRDPFAGRLPASEVLMPMLLDKFPSALIRAWDTNIGPDAAEEEDNLQKSEQRTPSSKPSRPEWRYGDHIRSTAAALAVVAVKGCSWGHKAEECEKFQQADLSGRRDMARIKEVCFRCLETGHMAKGCREGRPCGVDGCRQLHHKLLHPSPTTESPRSPRPDRARQGLLAARGSPGGVSKRSALKRTGRTGIMWPHERCRLTTLGGRVGPERRWRRVEFRLGAVEGSGRRGAGIRVQALVIPRRAPLVVDVLVGIDYYYELVTGRIRRATDESVAMETRLGWITCGRAVRNRAPEAGVFLLQGEVSDDDALRRFWEIEELGITPAEDTAADGTAAMKALEEELRLDEGRYSVSLPWVPGGPALPNNYSHARRRLLALERRLRAREEDRLQYDSVMKQYFDEGWAEPAPEASPQGRTWYLPHHAVYQGAGSERKCRVVFDNVREASLT